MVTFAGPNYPWVSTSWSLLKGRVALWFQAAGCSKAKAAMAIASAA